jgi:hypothetical protein
MAEKRCEHCSVTQSPVWRLGPPDKPCLCNGCGVRYMRRKTLEYKHVRDQYAKAKGSKKKSKNRIDESSFLVIYRDQINEIFQHYSQDYKSYSKFFETSVRCRCLLRATKKTITNTEDCMIVHIAQKKAICRETQAFAMNFHFLEGYSLLSSIDKGCVLFNDVYGAQCFKTSEDNMETPSNEYFEYATETETQLQKLCRRLHTKQVNKCAEKELYVKYHKTFWTCFRELLGNTSTSGDDQDHDDPCVWTESNMNQRIMHWNDTNQLELFIIGVGRKP